MSAGPSVGAATWRLDVAYEGTAYRGWARQPGQATVEVIGPRNDISAVKVGGSAVTVIRGELSL